MRRKRSVATGFPFTATRTWYAPGGAIGPACAPAAHRIIPRNAEGAAYRMSHVKVFTPLRFGARGGGLRGPAAAETASKGHAIRVARPEDFGLSVHHGVGQLLETADIVQHPEGTAMRSNDHVALLEDEIVHGNQRKVELQALPA